MANILVPLGLAGVLSLVGIWPLAVCFLFLPYWVALLLKQIDRRFHAHLPRSDGWFLASWSCPVTLLGMLWWFVTVHKELPKATFSFLLGIAFVSLWPLLLLLLYGVLRVWTWALRIRNVTDRFILETLLLPPVAALIIYALWIPPARILTLPLAAGAVLGFLAAFATMAVLGDRPAPPGP
jgi:hypothetical protein